jgi:hypothetical protein
MVCQLGNGHILYIQKKSNHDAQLTNAMMSFVTIARSLVMAMMMGTRIFL